MHRCALRCREHILACRIASPGHLFASMAAKSVMQTGTWPVRSKSLASMCCSLCPSPTVHALVKCCNVLQDRMCLPTIDPL